MKRQGLFVLGFGIVLALLMSACEGARRTPGITAPSPTPSATLLPPYRATAQYAEAAAQATLAAGQVAQMQAQLTATAAAISIRQAAATQAYFATATAQALQATATARAEATRQVQAQRTATAQALQVTATAQAMEVAYTATAQALHLAGTATVQAQQVSFQATQAAVMAQATAHAAVAEREVLALEQQRALNTAWAIARFLLAVGGVLLVGGLAVWMVMQWQRYRVVRLAAGKVLVRLGDGWYDPDRNPYPIAVLGPDGRPALPKLPPDDVQERTTARAQFVDLARTRGGKGLPRVRQKPRSIDNATVRFHIIEPREARTSLPGLVTPETEQILEAEWREVGKEGSR